MTSLPKRLRLSPPVRTDILNCSVEFILFFLISEIVEGVCADVRVYPALGAYRICGLFEGYVSLRLSREVICPVNRNLVGRVSAL